MRPGLEHLVHFFGGYAAIGQERAACRGAITLEASENNSRTASTIRVLFDLADGDGIRYPCAARGVPPPSWLGESDLKGAVDYPSLSPVDRIPDRARYRRRGSGRTGTPDSLTPTMA